MDFIRNQQDLCPAIKEVKAWLSNGAPLLQDLRGKELRAFRRELPNLTLGKDNILRWKCKEKNGTTQIVLPAASRSKVLEMLHNDTGHLGATKTKHRVQERYFWPYMAADIEEWCNKCIVCQQRRNPVPEHRALLQPIVTTCPGELVTMDIVEYPKSTHGS